MRNFFLPVLLGFAELNAAPVFARPPAKPIQKPADLPFRFRDFQIYSTSTPDTANPSRIIVSVQLHNKGNKPLMATVRLGANKVAGFAGNATRVLLKPHSQSVWKFDLFPTADLKTETLTGSISFGLTRARTLYWNRRPRPEIFQSHWTLSRSQKDCR